MKLVLELFTFTFEFSNSITSSLVKITKANIIHTHIAMVVTSERLEINFSGSLHILKTVIPQNQ